MNLAIDHLFRVSESEFWQSSRGNLWGQLAFDGNDGSAKRMIRPSQVIERPQIIEDKSGSSKCTSREDTVR